MTIYMLFIYNDCWLFWSLQLQLNTVEIEIWPNNTWDRKLINFGHNFSVNYATKINLVPFLFFILSNFICLGFRFIEKMKNFILRYLFKICQLIKKKNFITIDKFYKWIKKISKFNFHVMPFLYACDYYNYWSFEGN